MLTKQQMDGTLERSWWTPKGQNKNVETLRQKDREQKKTDNLGLFVMS